MIFFPACRKSEKEKELPPYAYTEYSSGTSVYVCAESDSPDKTTSELVLVSVIYVIIIVDIIFIRIGRCG